MNQYVLPLVVVVAYTVWRYVHAVRIRRTAAPPLMEGAAVIDVRSPAELARGHRPGSVNVPLAESANAPPAVDPDGWVIVCCASGTIIAVAKGILHRRGFGNVINGGSWRNVINGGSA